jgi:hypothetical protein
MSPRNKHDFHAHTQSVLHEMAMYVCNRRNGLPHHLDYAIRFRWCPGFLNLTVSHFRSCLDQLRHYPHLGNTPTQLIYILLFISSVSIPTQLRYPEDGGIIFCSNVSINTQQPYIPGIDIISGFFNNRRRSPCNH